MSTLISPFHPRPSPCPHTLSPSFQTYRRGIAPGRTLRSSDTKFKKGRKGGLKEREERMKPKEVKGEEGKGRKGAERVEFGGEVS